MLKDNTMNTADRIKGYEDTIMTAICADMITGVIYEQMDDETLGMMLEMVCMEKPFYRDRGVTIGEA